MTVDRQQLIFELITDLMNLAPPEARDRANAYAVVLGRQIDRAVGEARASGQQAERARAALDAADREVAQLQHEQEHGLAELLEAFARVTPERTH